MIDEKAMQDAWNKLPYGIVTIKHIIETYESAKAKPEPLAVDEDKMVDDICDEIALFERGSRCTLGWHIKRAIRPHLAQPKGETKREYVKLDKRILIAGNHLASALIGIEMPNNFKTYDEALEKHGQPYADMWCAWRAILDVRDEMHTTRPGGE